MIFFYLFVFSLIGLGILYVIEYRRSKESFTTLLKKLWGMNGRTIEDHKQKISRYWMIVQKSVTSSGVKHFSRARIYVESQGKVMRSYVRKKLHPETERSESSSFIKNMRNK
ncbi:hypothetical protein KC901_00330 [Patescibacteria group bacterium]|nr:hypothetical protein [Patescibacteria group bacterium]